MNDIYVPNLSTYDQMVRRLAKPGEDIIKTMTAFKADALHMAVGLAGEAIELLDAIDKNDRKNVLEELGDAKFFATHLKQILPEPCRDTDPMIVDEHWSKVPIADTPFKLLSLSGDILNDVKGLAIYNKLGTCDAWGRVVGGKVIDLDLLYIKCCRAIRAIDVIAVQWHFQPEEVTAGNMIKLEGKRYKAGYSDQAAAERADKTEGA